MDATAHDNTVERTAVAPSASRRRGVRPVVALSIWVLSLMGGIVAGELLRPAGSAPAEAAGPLPSTTTTVGSRSTSTTTERPTVTTAPAAGHSPGASSGAVASDGDESSGNEPAGSVVAPAAEPSAVAPPAEPDPGATATEPSTTTTTAAPTTTTTEPGDDPSWCTDQGGTLTYGPSGEPWDWRCTL